MGKNYRHKKMLKSEKAKIKLKVKSEKTTFLKKGLNETKLNFKIKPIILPEQLKQKGNLELLSKRKLNMKDILSRLHHHNVSVRHVCLNELQQIINSHIDELANHHLAPVLHGLPPLLLDDNKSVRHTVMSSLHQIMEHVAKSKLKPFFPILSSYLRCSMTNINRGIQEDSLGFLAILLKCMPEMVSEEGYKVLPNLFALISKFKAEAKPVRTLSLNLNTKLTSVKWHIQVLSGIYGFLKAINGDTLQGFQKCQSLVQVSVHQKARKYVPVVHNSYFSNNISFNSKLLASTDSKDDVIEKNWTTLIKLLYEIWMEVAPEKKMREVGDFTSLNSDAATILSCILNVMYLVLQRLIIQNEDNDLAYVYNNFSTIECKNFLLNVMSSFPYTKSTEGTKSDNSTVQKLLKQYLNTDVKFVRENLLICHLFCNLNRRLVRTSEIQDAKRILTYVEHCLITRGSINNFNMDCLLIVVRNILFDNLEWHRKVDIEMILVRFVNFYENLYKAESSSGTGKQNNLYLLNSLCQISQLSHLNKNTAYQKWLNNVSASLTAKEVSENVVDALLIVAKQNNREFLEGLRGRTPEILKNYKAISIVNPSHDQAKLKILYLFYYLPNMSMVELEALTQLYNDCDSQEKIIVQCLIERVSAEIKNI